ncbi:hypothetical protein KPH14_004949 [Odynerus spinipes]|uniref:Uncharacterized protein n=1 Tax=Odynerus spinipes TaxID=1348599 RepID=A0AAD9RMZ2_9HYME|nr:hypothetical protein KPH14_004949 [Odynerus spinipes]
MSHFSGNCEHDGITEAPSAIGEEPWAWAKAKLTDKASEFSQKKEIDMYVLNMFQYFPLVSRKGKQKEKILDGESWILFWRYITERTITWEGKAAVDKSSERNPLGSSVMRNGETRELRARWIRNTGTLWSSYCKIDHKAGKIKKR